MLYQDCNDVWYVKTRPAGTAFFNYELLHGRLPANKTEAEELLLSTLMVDRETCSSTIIDMVRDDVDVGEPAESGEDDLFVNALNAHLDANTTYNSSTYDFTQWTRA